MRARSLRKLRLAVAATTFLTACGVDFANAPNDATTSGGGGIDLTTSGTGGATGTTSGAPNGAGGTSVGGSSPSSSSASSSASSTAASSNAATSTGSGGPTCPGEQAFCANEFSTTLTDISDVVYTSGVWVAANQAIYRIPVDNPIPFVVGGKPGEAGSNDDPTGTNARFGKLGRVVYDSKTSLIYVVDVGNCRVRSISTKSPYAVKTVSGAAGACGSVVDGDANKAAWGSPYGITLDTPDKDGNHKALYVLDGNLVRKLEIGNGAVTLIAGQPQSGAADNAIGKLASFNVPHDLLFVGQPGTLYVADTGNHRLRAMASGPDASVTTVCGAAAGSLDGACNAGASLNGLSSVTPYSVGSGLLLADTENHSVRTWSGGVLTTVLGGQELHAVGVGKAAGIVRPTALATGTVNAIKTLFVVEDGKSLRRVPLE